MEYTAELVDKLLGPGEIITVGGLDVECKNVPDGPAGALDPRVLRRAQAQRETETGTGTTLEDARNAMGGFNYNLNRKEIYTRYLEIPTSAGNVPVWGYYPRFMEQNRPALIYVHGGAFMGGTPFQVENPCRLIAERANCLVWNVDYSLPPEHPYPIPCTQVYEVICHLHSHAMAFGMDPDRIVIAGDSAGGNLCAVAAQMDRDRGTRYIRGQILLYAKLTFTNTELPGYARDESAFEIVGEQKHLLPGMIGIGSEAANAGDERMYVQGRHDIRDPYISPAFGKTEDLPRTLLIQAEYDGLRLEGEYYGNKLRKAGVSVKMLRYRGVGHGFFDLLGILPQSEAVVHEIARFITETEG